MIEINCGTDEISISIDSTIVTTINNTQSLKELVTGVLRKEEGDNHGKPYTPYNDSLGYATNGIGKLWNGKKNFMKTKEQIIQECADLSEEWIDKSVGEQWLSEDIDKLISFKETISNIKLHMIKLLVKVKQLLFQWPISWVVMVYQNS